jgi:4-hydroxythreonine-4-phosphate dehydrogenase
MSKPILVTTGEPAGIGPDICIQVAKHYDNLVFIGDESVLQARAKQLGIELDFIKYAPYRLPKAGQMMVHNMPCKVPVIPGVMDPKNAESVLAMLEWSGKQVLAGAFSALVTAPVNKAQIQHADSSFLGHTEFFQKLSGSSKVVMMLSDGFFRVALVTTHLPLKDVPKAITQERILSIVETVYDSLEQDWGLKNPKIAIAGLNPHAGENGALGQEEIEIIIPAIKILQQKGIDAHGPMSADTMFLHKEYDVFIAMYHDQGLSVLKYATFGKAANISLGLPMIRTSVDHGTALHIAGTHQAKSDSMLTAIQMAQTIIKHRGNSI